MRYELRKKERDTALQYAAVFQIFLNMKSIHIALISSYIDEYFLFSLSHALI